MVRDSAQAAKDRFSRRESGQIRPGNRPQARRNSPIGRGGKPVGSFQPLTAGKNGATFRPENSGCLRQPVRPRNRGPARQAATAWHSSRPIPADSLTRTPGSAAPPAAPRRAAAMRKPPLQHGACALSHPPAAAPDRGAEAPLESLKDTSWTPVFTGVLRLRGWPNLPQCQPDFTLDRRHLGSHSASHEVGSQTIRQRGGAETGLELK